MAATASPAALKVLHETPVILRNFRQQVSHFSLFFHCPLACERKSFLHFGLLAIQEDDDEAMDKNPYETEPCDCISVSLTVLV